MEFESEYQALLDYLYSFVDFSLQKNLQFDPDRFNLQRMRAFGELLGSSHLSYPVIHVAGSKGKGSVSAICASVLRAAGYRSGLYISPHLSDYNERIQVDGTPISHAELIRLVDELKPQIESVPELSTFEITTGLAFLYFARQGVDIAVVEVGLGGRLDATNIVDPLVSVITTLGYEHTALLGNTLTQIATEKAGIIKPGKPVVLAPQLEEARLAVERIATERGSTLVEVGRDYLFQPGPHSLDGQSFQIWKPEGGSRADLKMPLLGYHQLENAATAYAALDTARLNGLTIPHHAIETGFESVSWPGRFEVLQRKPALVVDSAHTRDAAHKLRLALDDYFPGIPVVLVFGASEDKDIQGMFEELAGRVRMVIATRAEHPRAIEPQALLELASLAGLEGRIVEHVDRALEEALREAGGDAMVLAAGSIFVTAEVREAWFRRQVSE